MSRGYPRKFREIYRERTRRAETAKTPRERARAHHSRRLAPRRERARLGRRASPRCDLALAVFLVSACVCAAHSLAGESQRSRATSPSLSVSRTNSSARTPRDAHAGVEGLGGRGARQRAGTDDGQRAGRQHDEAPPEPIRELAARGRPELLERRKLVFFLLRPRVFSSLLLPLFSRVVVLVVSARRTFCGSLSRHIIISRRGRASQRRGTRRPRRARRFPRASSPSRARPERRRVLSVVETVSGEDRRSFERVARVQWLLQNTIDRPNNRTGKDRATREEEKKYSNRSCRWTLSAACSGTTLRWQA